MFVLLAVNDPRVSVSEVPAAVAVYSGPPGTSHVRYRVDCRGRTFADAMSLARTMRTAVGDEAFQLGGDSQTEGGATVVTTEFEYWS